ncbi:malate dehydrogenase MDH3 KNAG_0A05930 [Huiozyma naganishii CBS 8797]|uniref:Malate dehydrogenase n=1 Tax=Huiozyma naganishii (strain ATCC MYA-139 / BCRC 22969 / CBS 8797 / KCTC 17520 / NBRC 10181 / NCYC 3082 / Yp74L-3) TaxID=1071383 RepID=J7R0C8_HUIN7|nr:hypothetical protein KNAG_0A05930 [Kazachstania naganishii CBS 8797]CCK68255.1 hypothetical protein KNAG_0A05930 [Kazachstania naganishii CBS 8797]
MVKVAILGAAGGVGQPLSLLLKLSPFISELSLYDVQNPEGIATDLSHINTNSVCTGSDKKDLQRALTGAQVVVIPAGLARKPGMTRDDLFRVNASIVRMLCLEIGKTCPEATVLVISNPVNCLVPVAAETFRECGCFDAGRVLGITTLDIVRAESFLGDVLRKTSGQPQNKGTMGQKISVIGGHSGKTIVPILLEKSVQETVGLRAYEALINRIQFGGDEVIQAKKGAGSATLSMAYAGYEFTSAILESIVHGGASPNTKKRAHLPAYVYLPDLPHGAEAQSKLGTTAVTYFSLPVVIRSGRVVDVDVSILDNLTTLEKQMVSVAVPPIASNIDKGRNYVAKPAKL